MGNIIERSSMNNAKNQCFCTYNCIKKKKKKKKKNCNYINRNVLERMKKYRTVTTTKRKMIRNDVLTITRDNLK